MEFRFVDKLPYPPLPLTKSLDRMQYLRWSLDELDKTDAPSDQESIVSDTCTSTDTYRTEQSLDFKQLGCVDVNVNGETRIVSVYETVFKWNRSYLEKTEAILKSYIDSLAPGGQNTFAKLVHLLRGFERMRFSVARVKSSFLRDRRKNGYVACFLKTNQCSYANVKGTRTLSQEADDEEVRRLNPELGPLVIKIRILQDYLCDQYKRK